MIKNRDETMQRLLNAVGLILKEEGYTGLGVNKLALRAGCSKELVYRYFGSLNNLVKAYIYQRDYWQPLLKDLALADRHPLEIFTDLLQNQFRFFFEEKEMQRFIIWQISKYDPVLKSISEERERGGGRLLALTNDHFKDSGVNFRAVVALLVGGIYFVILHAEYNKSTISEMDAGLEEDREELIRTVGQILDWAWQAASHN